MPRHALGIIKGKEEKKEYYSPCPCIKSITPHKYLAAGVVEEGLVPHAHLVPHDVARLQCKEKRGGDGISDHGSLLSLPATHTRLLPSTHPPLFLMHTHNQNPTW